MDELKPCPFCGGAAKVESNYSEKKARWYTGIRCDKCFSRTRTFSTTFSPSEDERIIDWARNAWNQRSEA